ncbi:transcriptional regulator [Clostridia bacterium]|nr:transcriptional regulator [Clostridia bacterium]
MHFGGSGPGDRNGRDKMHITLETDYAIRMVDCLARGKARMGAQAIAEMNHVTLRFSLKILSKLAAGGIVRSYKGVRGGYELARPPGEISIGDILEIIEGPYEFSRCLNCEYKCTSGGDKEKCPYHRFFARISGDVRERLASATIYDMITEQPE